MDSNVITFSVTFVLFFMSVVAHEVAHGWAALYLGDDTAKLMGRLSFNPLIHVDLWMTIILPLTLLYVTHGAFVIGGAKPVPINPFNFKKPDRDFMITSLAGPFTNILIGLTLSLFLILFWNLGSREQGFRILLSITSINFFLAIFNMIPIPPLDGSRVLRYLMPSHIRSSLDRMEPYGMIILMLILFSPIGDYFFSGVQYLLNLYFSFILQG